jgi:hypothetical protein
MPENGITSADNFRKRAETRKVETQPCERVVLPHSRFPVLLRRPTPMWFLFHGHLPMSLAGKQSGAPAGAGGPIQTAEEFVAFSKWIVDLLSEVFVGPKVCLNPGTDEISPEWLAEEDVNFIIRWAVGEVTPEGRDLAEFCGKAAGPVPSPGPSGRSLSCPPEPVAQGDDDRPAN